MKVTLVYNGDSVRVHRAGCRDAKLEARTATTVYDMEAATQNDAAEDFYSDFIGESMTAEEAMGYTDFLPCTAGLEERAATRSVTKVTLLGPPPAGGSYTSTVDDPAVARLLADGWTEHRRWDVLVPTDPEHPAETCEPGSSCDVCWPELEEAGR